MIPCWMPLQVMTIRGALELAESQRLAAESARVARIHNIMPRTPGSQKQASRAEDCTTFGRNLESSKNVENHIGIHPQALISNLNPIINDENFISILQHIQKSNNSIGFFAVFFPYRAPTEPCNF